MDVADGVNPNTVWKRGLILLEQPPIETHFVADSRAATPILKRSTFYPNPATTGNVNSFEPKPFGFESIADAAMSGNSRPVS